MFIFIKIKIEKISAVYFTGLLKKAIQERKKTTFRNIKNVFSQKQK